MENIRKYYATILVILLMISTVLPAQADLTTDEEDSEKPDVTTNTATGITENQATLKGKLEDDGGDPETDTWFKYKKSTEILWTNEEAPDVPEGSTFQKTITGLEPGTEYKFKACATNEKGTDFGGENTFTTGGANEDIVVSINIEDDNIGTDWVEVTGTLESGPDLCECSLAIVGVADEYIGEFNEGESFSYKFEDCGLKENETYTAKARAEKDGEYDVKTTSFKTLPEGKSVITKITDNPIKKGTTWAVIEGTVVKGKNCECCLYIVETGEHSQLETHNAGENFIYNFTGLSEDTTYHVRAHIENATGLHEDETSFKTKSEEENPIKITISVDETGQDWVNVSGELIEDGGLDCKCKLLIYEGWETTAKDTEYLGIHNKEYEYSYTFENCNLKSNTNYRVRVKAWNEAAEVEKYETAWGQTKPGKPSVSTIRLKNKGTDWITVESTLTEHGSQLCSCHMKCIETGEQWDSARIHKSGYTFEYKFDGLEPGKEYNFSAWAENIEEESLIEKAIFTTEEVNQIIKSYPKETGENTQFKIETNVAADFTYKYNGETVENKYSATFNAPYHEDLEEGKDTVLVEVKANDITENAEIKVKDYLKIEFIVDRTEVLEGDDLKITVKDQDNENLLGALVKVVNDNSGEAMSKNTRINGQVIFSKRDYNSLSVDEDVTCTISVEKKGYDLIDGEKTVKVKNAFLKIVTPSSGEEFQERDYVQVTINDQDDKLFDGAKIELEDSPDRHVYTEDGKAEILAPSVFEEEGEYVEKTLTVRDTYGIYEEDELTIKIKDMWDDIVPIDIQICDGNTIPAEPIENAEITFIRKDSRTEKNHETDKNGMAHIEVYPTSDGKDFTYYRVEISKEGYQSIKVFDWPGKKISLDSPPVEVSCYLYNSSFLSNMNQNSDFDVKFTYSPINPKVGDKIKFNAACKSSEDIIDAWYWDFGDLDISTDKNPEHKYKREGDYIVTLAVKDDNDNIVSHSIEIKIAEDDGRIHLGNFISNFLSQFRNKIKNRSFLSFSISELLN